ncbi:MAG TPA: inorganic phosphate transporter [Salinimicrobium sp.]|nr:inorganic phosphate transporter [Salinimicrobium sp.]
MEDVYIVMLVVLFALAITDLVVGVSNDAVNFLNSAIGSKALPIKTILIIACCGVAAGAIFSSGLMEVARKGIFNPGQFYFDEIMIIFMAVMIADVLLLDFFNSLGLPTSTTVSIVFELLGAAVCVALIKIYHQEDGFDQLYNYINTSKASEIIIGILLSVAVAFSAGAIVQYFARLAFSFEIEKKIKNIGALFGGISITAILYFILIKGLKTVSFISKEILSFVLDNSVIFIVINLGLWSLICHFAIKYWKINILKIIIAIGTFALALAFAGNDLVNFIGVPIAAWQSFELWQDAYLSTGMMPNEFLMTGLEGNVETPLIILVLAGLVMVLTLVFSSKSKSVIETGVNLSRQGDGEERFTPNFLSRTIVRYSLMIGNIIERITPKSWVGFIESKFKKPSALKYNDDAPAFDMVRASVNLVVASILISLGTNMKLPLSTTYVTFMVAMGTSLADRAWDRESAVYRVAGVVNVIGGWFVTALVAFTAAAAFALVIWYGRSMAIVVLVGFSIFLVTRNAVLHSKKMKKKTRKKLKYNTKELLSINEMLFEISEHISDVVSGVNKRYTKTVDNLGVQDVGKLKKNNKAVKKLNSKIDKLKGNVFYFIKSLDEDSVGASKFYILILDHLQAIVLSIGFITRNSYNHVNNNHKNLKFNQLRELKNIDEQMQVLFKNITEVFDAHSFGKIKNIIKEEEKLLEVVSALIQKQIIRIRTSETSPKNSKLYFSLLLETKDLITSTIHLLQLFLELNSEVKKALKK